MNLAQSGRRVIPQQPSITSVSVIHPSKYGPPASLSRRAFTSQLPLLTLRKVLCSASVTKAAASGELLRTSPPPQTPTTLLWFKHDLRVDDHPGLHAALKASTTVIPVFCFDPKRYEQLVHSPGSASALAGAVASLRSTLRALGSDLVILTGSWEVELPQVAEAVGAEVVLAEEEIETVYRQGLERTAQALGPGVKVHTWCAPLFEASSDNYKGS